MDLPTDDSVWQHKWIIAKRSADLLFCWHGHYPPWNWLSPRKYSRPSQKETSFTTSIFQATCFLFSGWPVVALILTQRPGGFSRKLMDSNRVPGIICALGWVVVVSKLPKRRSFFFLGGGKGGEKTAMENFMQIYTQCFLNGVIRDSGFCGLISLTTKNGRSFDFWWSLLPFLEWKGDVSFCMVFYQA